MAKASRKSTPAPAPAGKIIFADARLEATLHKEQATDRRPYLKPFVKVEAEAAIKRGRDAKRVLASLPPSPVGRPPKYAAIIAATKQRIETGGVATPKGLSKFARSLTTSTAAAKTIRNNLRPIWNAALKK